MLYVQSNCRKHSCNLCCNFCRLEFRGFLMWMEQHFQIMKSCSPGTRLNTFSHRSRNVARTEWVTWFWLQSILCVALSKFANIGPTCIVHMVSPSEGSLMNVYWLHSWSVSRLAHSGSHLVALQGRGKVFPILVKDGTLYTCTQIVAPSIIKEGVKTMPIPGLGLCQLPCLVLLLHLRSASHISAHHIPYTLIWIWLFYSAECNWWGLVKLKISFFLSTCWPPSPKMSSTISWQRLSIAVVYCQRLTFQISLNFFVLHFAF